MASPVVDWLRSPCEGNSNNFPMLISSPLRSAILAIVSLSSAVWLANAQTPDNRPSAQQMLDFLASPAPKAGPMAMPGDYPKQYADWTEDQRKSGLRLVLQHCVLINALVHDNPSTRILPQPMTMAEESRLAVSVCIVAKMPGDWPVRRKYVDIAEQLIAKAVTNGASLHLPETLAP